MNVYDTEGIISLLEKRGHSLVDSPQAADCIVVNTCSVREHAEQRALGRLRDLSRHHGATIVVCGCMAQRLGTTLFDLVPAVRIVAGTSAYGLLPDALLEAAESDERIALLGTGDVSHPAPGGSVEGGRVSRYVAIVRGCENYCSYCIVPFLRGKVRSRDADSIVEEVALLVDRGVREVTLLGQNVIAYRHGSTGFTSLAKRVLEETGLRRLRFLTSHPRDIGADVFELMASNNRFCSHVHLPVQAGSNRILASMNRGYTRERYLEKVREARSIVPEIGITTDIIVGFPSETEADFLETLDIVREARFDAAFTFQYSPRDGTAATLLDDDVPPRVKRERLRILNAAVQEERGAILRAQLGAGAEILLDGAVQKGEYGFLKGRTPQFRNVLVPCGRLREGDVVRVVLKRLVNFTFEGEVTTER